MTEEKMKVCVVGAGVSGLVTVKELLEEGHDVVCFKQEAREGGVFYHPKGIAYDSMLLNVSQNFMSYSSMPPIEEDKRAFWSRRRYARYLREFAKGYDLFKHIQFETEVTGVEANESGVRVRYKRDNQAQEAVFDAIAICRGAFRSEALRMPKIPGMDQFDGKLTHSAEYRSPDQFRDLRVLCEGMGESSADITKQISEVAAKCVLSMRRYPELRSRYTPDGETIDAGSNRMWHWYPLELREKYREQLFNAIDRTASAHARLVHDWSRKSGRKKAAAAWTFRRRSPHVQRPLLSSTVCRSSDRSKRFARVESVISLTNKLLAHDSA